MRRFAAEPKALNCMRRITGIILLIVAVMATINLIRKETGPEAARRTGNASYDRGQQVGRRRTSRAEPNLPRLDPQPHPGRRGFSDERGGAQSEASKASEPCSSQTGGS